MKTIWRCKVCDSPDIETTGWIKVNEDIPGEGNEDIFEPDHTSANWCNNCQEHTALYEDVDQLQKPEKNLL